jgi:hypothetical protein
MRLTAGARSKSSIDTTSARTMNTLRHRHPAMKPDLEVQTLPGVRVTSARAVSACARWPVCLPERSCLGNLPSTLCVFVEHESESGHGDDQRPHRFAWACPRSIVALTTGKRFRDSIGTVLIVWRAGTSSSSSSTRRAQVDRGPYRTSVTEKNRRMGPAMTRPPCTPDEAATPSSSGL